MSLSMLSFDYPNLPSTRGAVNVWLVFNSLRMKLRHRNRPSVGIPLREQQANIAAAQTPSADLEVSSPRVDELGGDPEAE